MPNFSFLACPEVATLVRIARLARLVSLGNVCKRHLQTFCQSQKSRVAVITENKTISASIEVEVELS